MSWVTGTWISVRPPAIKSGWRASGAATRSKGRPCHDQIRASLGLDFLDRLNDLEGEMSDYERLACFRHGFRLAGRLLMELLP